MANESVYRLTFIEKKVVDVVLVIVASGMLKVDIAMNFERVGFLHEIALSHTACDP